jgi:hypothetical protein
MIKFFHKKRSNIRILRYSFKTLNQTIVRYLRRLLRKWYSLILIRFLSLQLISIMEWTLSNNQEYLCIWIKHLRNAHSLLLKISPLWLIVQIVGTIWNNRPLSKIWRDRKVLFPVKENQLNLLVLDHSHQNRSKRMVFQIVNLQLQLQPQR